jgi:DNA-directed RNA polymerase subunit M/transcription elongation factor TFIIS
MDGACLNLSTVVNDVAKVKLRLRGVRSLTNSVLPWMEQMGWSKEQCFAASRSIEEQIYSVTTISKMDYSRKVLQLTWNLHANGGFLLRKYTSETLARVDDALLAETTDIDLWWRQHKDKQNREKVLLNDEAKFDETEQLSNKGLTCNRCHSRLIAINQQQIRSADEGMTVFCTCKKCGMRWKM